MSQLEASPQDAIPELAATGGEAGRLIAALDWSQTSLGPIGRWPQSLRTATSILLNSPVPIVMLWGGDGLMLYNDAYSVFAGGRHPQLLGSKVREGWPEVADFNDNVMRVGLAGGTLAYRDQELTLHRHGRPEQVWMNLDYSPVLDEGGRPAGVICILAETTERVAAERRAQAERDRQQRMLQQMPGFAAVLAGPEHRYEYVNDAYREISGERDFVGRTVREVFPDLAGQGIYELLDQVYVTGEPFAARTMPIRLDRPDGDRFIDLLYEAVRDEAGRVTGIFVGGYDVTAAHLAREALHESERDLHFALEAGRFGAWTLDLATGELVTSATCRANFGRPTDQPFSYADLREAVHVDDRARMAGAVDLSIATGAKYDIEYRIVTPAGETRWVAIRAKPAYAADGVPLGMAGVSIDITERKQTEAQLARVESRYRMLFDAVDAGFCILELKFDEAERAIDYRHVEINAAFDRQTGMKDHVGKWMSDIIPDLEKSWFEIYGEVARTGDAVRFENRAGPLNRWFDVHAFRPEPPEDRRVAVLFTDITKRKQAEDRLRDLNETLETLVADRTAELRFHRDIIEATTSPICAFDAEYRLIAFNKAHNDEFRRVNGFDTKLGDVLPDQFIPEQREVMRKLMRRALAGESFMATEEFGRPEFGQPLWEISYTPLRDETGAIIGAFHLATDISDRLRAEADLAAAQEALRQSQKMEAVGQLTGGLAHDFNNLLAGITGSLDLMGARLSQGRVKDVDKYMTAAQGAAKRAAALTHRLLAFSRRQTLDPKPTNINALVSGMAELIQRTVGPAIQVETVQASGLWPTLVDPPQLENALLNLCINARDAMPEGGRITIETANKWLDRQAAAKQDVPEGQYLSLCVTDTGVGMSADLISKIFDPFFTTKPIGQGTGLGLSMIYGFAKQSGGQVRVYSEVGEGTTMCIYLPRHYGEADIRPVEPAPASLSAAGDGETVLVVDDEPTVRMLVTDVLDDLGYSAIEAADSLSGLKVLQSGVRIDLLITDVGLPGGMNGRQMADAAREARPGLKVLFITGYAENAVLNNGHLSANMQVMTKPFAVEALAKRIRELIDA